MNAALAALLLWLHAGFSPLPLPTTATASHQALPSTTIATRAQPSFALQVATAIDSPALARNPPISTDQRHNRRQSLTPELRAEHPYVVLPRIGGRQAETTIYPVARLTNVATSPPKCRDSDTIC